MSLLGLVSSLFGREDGNVGIARVGLLGDLSLMEEN